MKQSTASRRLVKSPPELWAEVSTEDSLNRHLAGFGEIRITRVDPETTVAWEGDRVSGTVELTPTGWGTKVMLTATPLREAAARRSEEGGARAAPPAEPEPQRADRERVTPQVAAPAPRLAAAPAAKQGFFARMFHRRPEPAPASGIPGPPLPTPDPTPPTPTPSPGPGPIPPPAPEPMPPTPAPAPPPAPQIQTRPPLSTARTEAILSDVLDDLGAAHHRPFSRD